jgi:plastocyanin
MQIPAERATRATTLRRRGPLSLTLVFLLAVGGCSLIQRGGGSGGAQTIPTPPGVQPREGTVVLANVAYHPPRVTVPVGREVAWIWDDNGLVHTVTADDGSFDSGRKTSGEFTQVFTQPGEYAYHCQIHARMKGSVVVEGS